MCTSQVKKIQILILKLIFCLDLEMVNILLNKNKTWLIYKECLFSIVFHKNYNYDND